MSVDNGHPWLNQANAKPKDPESNARYEERAFSLDSRGIDARDIRRAVGEDFGAIEDPTTAMRAFQRDTMAVAMAGEARRPDFPLLENNNTSTISDGQMFASAPSVSQPFPPQTGGGGSDHPFRVILNGSGGASVASNSQLFANLSYLSNVGVSGAGSTFSTSGIGDRIWLQVDFSSWPDTFTASISSLGSGGTWGDGEIETDPVTNEQTIARMVIALIVNDGFGFAAVRQIAFTHYRMWLNTDGGLTTSYPKPA